MKSPEATYVTGTSKVSLWGLLAATGAVACALTLSGFLGSAWWVFDETSHFRTHYGLGLFVLAIAFGIKKRKREALAFTAFAAINSVVVIPYCWPNNPQTPRTNNPILRVALINVLTTNPHHDLVQTFVRKTRPDVVVFEEVDESWMRSLEELKDILPYSCGEPRDDNFGIAMFSRLPLTNASVRYFGSAEVPSVSAEIQVEETKVLLLGTHPLPPAGAERVRLRNESLEEVARFVATNSGTRILIGDLNTTPWSSVFRRFKRDSGLIDTFQGAGYQATWPARLGILGIPLDHVFISPDLTVRQRRRGPNVGSDHLPVLVEVEVSRGVGK